MARKFFYVCAGMLMLALSYHFGASTATAQQGTSVVGAFSLGNGGPIVVLTPNGDVFYRHINGGLESNALVSLGNFWGGGPTPALHETWGQVKARYRATPGMTVTPGADDR